MVNEWSHKWLIKFNPDNYKLLQLGLVYKQNETITASSKAVAKAMQTLGMMNRSFKYLSKDSFLFLYKIYIRPHLEYCVPTWSPYLAKDNDALERVQHHATKLVKSLSIIPYEDRLISFQLQSLYCCRQCGDLIET